MRRTCLSSKMRSYAARAACRGTIDTGFDQARTCRYMLITEMSMRWKREVNLMRLAQMSLYNLPLPEAPTRAFAGKPLGGLWPSLWEEQGPRKVCQWQSPLSQFGCIRAFFTILERLRELFAKPPLSPHLSSSPAFTTATCVLWARLMLDIPEQMSLNCSAFPPLSGCRRMAAACSSGFFSHAAKVSPKRKSTSRTL